MIWNDGKWFHTNTIAIHMVSNTAILEPVSDTGPAQMQRCGMLELGLRQKPFMSAKSEENVQSRVTGVAFTSTYFVQRTPACLRVWGCLTVLSFGMLCPYLIVLYQ